MENLLNRLTTRNALLIIGSTVLLFFAVFGLFAIALNKIEDSALLFVGFLLVSTTGLALAAAVFKALGATSTADAFGLPSGSIRALIAISIMVLFVIFGLPFVKLEGAPERLSDKPFETVTTPCANVEAEVDRYRRIKIVAIPDLLGCDQLREVENSSSLLSNSMIEAGNATLKLYSSTQEYTSNQLEFGKLILTAIITLLTTIVGFYFGSQSALAIVNAAQGGANNTPQAPVTPQLPQAPASPQAPSSPQTLSTPEVSTAEAKPANQGSPLSTPSQSGLGQEVSSPSAPARPFFGN